MTFKVIIAGGRDFNWTSKHLERIDKILYRFATTDKAQVPCFYNLEMVTGTASGADQIPYYYKTWFGVPIKEFPSDWKNLDVPICKIKYNKFGAYNALAGFNRNQDMANYADALIAFWDGESSGTLDMIERAVDANLKVRVIRYD